MDERNENKGINFSKENYFNGKSSCGLPGHKNKSRTNFDSSIDSCYDVNINLDQYDNQGEIQRYRCGYDYSVVSHTVLDLFRKKRITDFSFTIEDRNLWFFVEKSLKKYCNSVEARIEKDFDWDRNNMLCYFFLTHLIKEDVNNLLSTHGKIQYQWWGFTYRLVDSRTQYYQVGYSTEPDYRRYYRYLNAVFKRSRHYFTNGKKQIYGYMYQYLKDKGLENFILEYSGDGTIKWDFKKVHSSLKEVFKYEITGVFWSEGLMKQAEGGQIKVGTLREIVKIGQKQVTRKINIEEKASRAEIEAISDKYNIPEESIGNALNDSIASGKGGASSNFALPYLATYAALGYTIPKITDILQNRHGFKQHLENFESVRKELYHFIEHQFDSVSNLYSLFLTPMFHELYDEHYSMKEVSKLYSGYLNSKTQKPFNTQKFIELASKGWEPIEMIQYEPSFWHFLGSSEKFYNGTYGMADKLTSFINRKIIPELDEYKHLKTVFQKDKIVFEDLKYFLMAPGVIELLTSGVPYKEVGQHFITPLHEDGFGKHIVHRILKKVHHTTWDTMRVSINRGLLNQLIISTPEKNQTLEFLASELLLSSETVRKNYLSSYFAFKPNHKPSEIGRLQWSNLLAAQIAIVGPILYQCYVWEFNAQEIIEKISFFENVLDVSRWTTFLFDKIDVKFNQEHLRPRWWYDNWGVNVDSTKTNKILQELL